MAAQQPPSSRRVDPSDPTFLQRLADDDARVTGYVHHAPTTLLDERPGWRDSPDGAARARVEFDRLHAEIRKVGEILVALENPTSESDA